MDEAGVGNSTSDRIYLPAERWRALLDALQQANRSPPDQAQALRAVIGFLDAVPAVRESGITGPLHQVLASLPDLVRLGACWNQLTSELLATVGNDATMAETACAQLRAMLTFANSVAGGEITAMLLPLADLQAEAELEAQRGHDLVHGGSG